MTEDVCFANDPAWCLFASFAWFCEEFLSIATFTLLKRFNSSGTVALGDTFSVQNLLQLPSKVHSINLLAISVEKLHRRKRYSFWRYLRTCKNEKVPFSVFVVSEDSQDFRFPLHPNYCWGFPGTRGFIHCSDYLKLRIYSILEK